MTVVKFVFLASVTIVGIHRSPNTMPGETFAEGIASGTQDLAALAGVFCTDSVEQNVHATQDGYVSVTISSMSMLGILGLVKSALKIAMGLERCRDAGFNLESIRGIFGYAKGEFVTSGDLIDCDIITVIFSADNIAICKSKRLLSNERCPMLTVGSLFPRIGNPTLINLGNVVREAAITQNPLVSLIFALIFSGFTAWTVLIIEAPWSWVRIFAIAGLQTCLLLTLALPLWYEYQTGRPACHLTVTKYAYVPISHKWRLTNRRWDSIVREVYDKHSQVTLLQARILDMDVLHFQGDTSLLHSPYVKVLSLIASFGISVAYICQYAIVKTANNVEAIIWVSCQAAAAFARVMFWISRHTFDKSHAAQTEIAIINTAASAKITFLELICAYGPGQHKLPRWAWDYLRTKDLQEILQTAATRVPAPIPVDVAYHSFVHADFDIFLDRRGGLDAKEESENKQFKGRHIWRLGMFKRNSNSDTIEPFILVHVPYSHGMCWMIADASSVRIDSEGRPGVLPAGHIEGICAQFALDDSGNRLHLRSHQIPEICDIACPHTATSTTYCGHLDQWESFMYLYDRSKICSTLVGIIESGADLENGIFSKKINNLSEDVWVSATPGTVDRSGVLHTKERDRIFGFADLEQGLKEVRAYIEQRPLKSPKNEKKTGNP